LYVQYKGIVVALFSTGGIGQTGVCPHNRDSS
jgi:hypothetical protein